ncbi:Tll0287-like domain-containing protein [Wenzhouxiangella marina]|uniref:Cytochrome C n=1 Tax=Wenzhouxiangella marina TaxID=1579979 RepID=A0A0K0XVF9_9GAMM|nr:DUF3365 domain-containing protein [Wenzhouxiangella marina]AKS41606.1 Cytochrome C [Wenzhouxiangella marina]MBB6086635.1 hypothetical protein [Wenzhouxiangella marina]
MGLRGLSLALLCLAAPTFAQDAPPPWVGEARQSAQQLGTQLKQALLTAIESEGLIAAIEVCQRQAPAIAEELSGDQGSVGRTALRVRNPDNRPDAWEQRILAEFEARLAAGEAPGNLERFAIRRLDDRRVGHWMKAIPTDGLCLACHGSEIAPELRQAIEQRYPEDQATGFGPGSLRGAFSVQIELPSSD